MCATIVINKGAVEITTPREFIDVFKSPPVKESYYNSIHLDSCLCQIDIEKSLVGAGIHKWGRDGMDYFINSDQFPSEPTPPTPKSKTSEVY